MKTSIERMLDRGFCKINKVSNRIYVKEVIGSIENVRRLYGEEIYKIIKEKGEYQIIIKERLVCRIVDKVVDIITNILKYGK